MQVETPAEAQHGDHDKQSKQCPAIIMSHYITHIFYRVCSNCMMLCFASFQFYSLPVNWYTSFAQSPPSPALHEGFSETEVIAYPCQSRTVLTAVKCITVLAIAVWSELGVGLHHLRRSEAMHSILHSKAGKSVLNRSCGASLYADLFVDQVWHPRNYAVAIISAAQSVIERKRFCLYSSLAF